LKTIGILISGRGSNMVSLLEGIREGRVPARCGLVLSNVPGAPGLEKAGSFGVPTAVIDHRESETREEHDRAMARVLEAAGVELVCLAGYMRLLSDWFVDRFPQRILNIHPSLLPAFPGLHVPRKALRYGARISGCTVHLVDKELDHGPIVIQAAVPVEEEDTPATLAARILEQEHRIYPEAVRLFCEDRLSIEGRRVRVRLEGPPEKAVPILRPAPPD
jgi:phosphoribosylglycinamide formyltransferase-1